MAEEIRGNELVTRLIKTLEKYVSPITVQAILKPTFAKEKIDPLHLTKQDLERIYQSSIFTGIRTFCGPDKLTDAMLDLAKLIE